MQKPLTKEEFLGLPSGDQLLHEWVDLAAETGKEGAGLLVWRIGGTDRDAFEADVQKLKKQFGGFPVGFRAACFVHGVRGTDGRKVFGQADAQAVGEKDGTILDRVMDVFLRINAIAAKDVAELEKN
jgi:hypothetical protein